MPRIARVAVADTFYHVINRANERAQIFRDDADYRHFESLLQEGKELYDMRIISYCIMPNHWHLILYPRKDTDMGAFMRWITTTHVRQRRAGTSTIGHGHLYQGTYKSFPVQTDAYLQQVICYVEQNPLRAKLVKRAEQWRWSSLWRRERGSAAEKKLLADLPIDLPKRYLSIVNTVPPSEALGRVRRSVNKGAPYGSEPWVSSVVRRFGLESTLRGPGRPRKH